MLPRLGERRVAHLARLTRFVAICCGLVLLSVLAGTGAICLLTVAFHHKVTDLRATASWFAIGMVLTTPAFLGLLDWLQEKRGNCGMMLVALSSGATGVVPAVIIGVIWGMSPSSPQWGLFLTGFCTAGTVFGMAYWRFYWKATRGPGS